MMTFLGVMERAAGGGGLLSCLSHFDMFFVFFFRYFTLTHKQTVWRGNAAEESAEKLML